MKALRVQRLLVLLVAAAGLYLLSGLLPPRHGGAFDLNSFAQLPVLHGGRIKPLDTIARTSLLMLSGKQTLRLQDRSIPAIQWLLDMLYRAARANDYAVFEIDDPDVLGMLGIQAGKMRRFSFQQILSQTDEIDAQAMQAENIKPEKRSRFQTAIVTLQQRVHLYQKLQNTLQLAGASDGRSDLHDIESRLLPALERQMQTARSAKAFDRHLLDELERFHFLDQVAEFYPVPLYRNPGVPRQWVSVGRGAMTRVRLQAHHPAVIAYALLGDAWRQQDARAFNAALSDYQRWLQTLIPRLVFKARVEYGFNVFGPFYRSLVLYVGVALLILSSWIMASQWLNRTAFAVLVLAFIVHTAGLILRMLLQGRPPVTNLYSSAIFVGWVAVLLGIILERLYRNGIGSLVSSIIGFITLIVAHHLASSGDTLEMMRAVLDSNFWLATHVVTITVGYGSTFLSGFLAIVYIVRRGFDRSWNATLARNLDRMVYGIVCFSTLSSFVGTILGGIWADQSWGRFWGWDPKENGALMIVLWNAFILHAHWGGLAEGKNLMLLAIGGNIITALSWFGVNMLGIGLHSYGFMDKAFVWLLLFVLSQLALIFVAQWRFSRRRTGVP